MGKDILCRGNDRCKVKGENSLVCSCKQFIIPKYKVGAGEWQKVKRCGENGGGHLTSFEALLKTLDFLLQVEWTN